MRARWMILTAISALLVLALSAPAIATPKNEKARGSTGGPSLTEGGAAQAQGPPAAVAEAQLERLRERIEQMLRNRKQRFDKAEARIAAHIERVEGLADRVEAAGGDASGARAALTQARAHLGSAAALEAEAVELFKAVPDSDDKRAALKAAREKGKAAAAELRSARKSVKEALGSLREEIRELRSDTDAPDGT